MACRDSLHRAWDGRGLWVRMLILISAGGVVSLVAFQSSAQVATASCVAFVASGLVDALVFAAMSRRAHAERANLSNVVSALVDSLVFPTLAFGSFMPLVVLAQWVAKVAGGFLWTALWLRRTRARRTR